MLSKVCKVCSQEKSVEVFRRSRPDKPGRINTCDSCRCEINRVKAAERRKKSPEKEKEVAKRFREKHRERLLANMRKWRAKNKDHVSKYNREKYPDRGRRRLVQQRTICKDPEVLEQIKTIYRIASNLELLYPHNEYQVDHIVPLTNKDVCGLHVPWNLAIINKDENLAKRNKFDGTYCNTTYKSKYTPKPKKVADEW